MKKYINAYIVQEMVEGKWCDACEEESHKAARATAKEYRENGYDARTITRRVLNRDAAISTAVLNHCRGYFRCHGAWPESMIEKNKNGTVKFTLNLAEMREILGDNDCRLVTEPMLKIDAMKAGLYRFKTPGVTPARWNDQDWINYIDAYKGWTVPVQ